MATDAITEYVFSFIVPVYNTEKYIEECLQSLLNQDIPIEDYEIICVNDGSKNELPPLSFANHVYIPVVCSDGNFCKQTKLNLILKLCTAKAVCLSANV